MQAQKFGVRIKLAAKAVSLSSRVGLHRVGFDDGDAVTAKSVIIATGARHGNDGPFGTIKAISRLRTVTMKRPGKPNGQCYTLWLT